MSVTDAICQLNYMAVKNADLGKSWQNQGQAWLILCSSKQLLAVVALSHRLTHVGINRMCYISSSNLFLCTPEEEIHKHAYMHTHTHLSMCTKYVYWIYVYMYVHVLWMNEWFTPFDSCIKSLRKEQLEVRGCEMEAESQTQRGFLRVTKISALHNDMGHQSGGSLNKRPCCC